MNLNKTTIAFLRKKRKIHTKTNGHFNFNENNFRLNNMYFYSIEKKKKYVELRVDFSIITILWKTIAHTVTQFPLSASFVATNVERKKTIITIGLDSTWK